MAYIEVIGYEKSDGLLKGIYDDIIKKRGKLADVHTIQSLHPETIVRHMDLYMEIMFGDSPLSRAQREMIAVIVSAANQCRYCTVHHSNALKSIWNDNEKVNALAQDFKKSKLDEQELLLSSYALELTVNPDIIFDVLVEGMKKAGLNDRAILDATIVIAYFNFVNRIVKGLGVELEHDGGTGYNY